jgi:hypothetical protein
MGRRVLVCVALTLAFSSPASPAGAASWAQAQIRLVTSQGLMGGSPSAFRPDDALTKGELADLVSGLTGKETPMALDPTTPVTMAQLDAQLVRMLGLLPLARQFSAGLRAAGLTPVRNFGTEVVTRLLGLRVNHPRAQDELELGPDNPATRAETAYSAARILSFTGGEVELASGLGATFQLPALTPLRRDILQTAVSFIGYPYVWGGTMELPQDPFTTGTRVPGGFDCSGFVWRLYKLAVYPGAESLGATLKGRTTYAMSAEVTRARRIPLVLLQPADILFFGARGARSRPADIDHMGVYLGNGWFIQASEQGVALASLNSVWYSQRFAWGRSPIAEANLS